MTLMEAATTDDIEALRAEVARLHVTIASQQKHIGILRESLTQWHDIASTLAVFEGERVEVRVA